MNYHSKLILTLLFSCFVFVTYAQKNKNKDEVPVQPVVPQESYVEKAYATQETVYHNALSYNDLGVAAVALHEMLALKPENVSLKDSLAYVYFGSQAYVQTILIGREIIAANAANKGVLELVAVSEQNLGLVKESLEDYEKLFVLSKDPYHLYQVAVLQYSMKRFLECSASLEQIIVNPDVTDEQLMVISDPSGQQQKVPLKAATYNMYGVIAMELGKNDVAEQSFNEALKIFPDFALAKGNLDQLKNPKADDKGGSKGK